MNAWCRGSILTKYILSEGMQKKGVLKKLDSIALGESYQTNKYELPRKFS
jgi:hypothetical protein